MISGATSWSAASRWPLVRTSSKSRVNASILMITPGWRGVVWLEPPAHAGLVFGVGLAESLGEVPLFGADDQLAHGEDHELRSGPPSALPSRQPADQPGPAHHGHRPAPQPDRGPRLLRPQKGIRQDVDGSHEGAEAAAGAHPLPADDQRRHSIDGDGSGRTPGNVNKLQRDRLSSPYRLFGEVTSRTRRHTA